MPRRPRAGRAPISGVALVLALIITLLAGAPAQAAGGTLAGTLRGPDGTPFEYFRVDLYQADGPDAWTLSMSRRITSWDSGLPVGQFEIALPAGSYRACFTALTYEPAESVGTRCWSGAFEVFEATDIVITEGGTTTITPRLPREAEVRGRVSGADDTGVSVYVAPYRRALDGTWTWVSNAGAQSGPDGTFVITDLDPGRYRFCVVDVPREYLPECWADQPTPADADDLAIGSGGRPAIYFRLARRANISGTVARPPGSTEYLAVVAYHWQNARWRPVAWATVAEDGTYRVTGLDAGTYRVCANGYDVVQTCWRQGSSPADATDIDLATGQYRKGVDLAPGPAGFVTGTLPDMYLGAEGYPEVTAWRQRGDAWESVATGDAYPTGIGSDWTYRIGSLPTGSFVVCVEHLEPEFVPAFPVTCFGDSPTPQGGTPVEVVAGQTTSGVDLPTNLAGDIFGRVTGTTERVRIDLHTASGRLAVSRTTDPEGFYRFRDLPAGSYYVGFHREATRSAFAAEWWRDRLDRLGPSGATPVTVNGDIIKGIRAILDHGGVITGRLVDASGDPVVGCQLRARAPDNALAVRRTVTDAEGDFAIGGLSTASYLVLVTRACSGVAAGLYYDAASPTLTTAQVRGADPVAVVRGQTVSLAGDLVTATP